jgi:hypothetical protein
MANFYHSSNPRHLSAAGITLTRKRKRARYLAHGNMPIVIFRAKRRAAERGKPAVRYSNHPFSCQLMIADRRIAQLRESMITAWQRQHEMRREASYRAACMS